MPLPGAPHAGGRYLRALRHLSLDDCQLLEIPPAICAATQLTRFELSRSPNLSVTRAGLEALRALAAPGGALARLHLRGCGLGPGPNWKHEAGAEQIQAALPGVELVWEEYEGEEWGEEVDLGEAGGAGPEGGGEAGQQGGEGADAEGAGQVEAEGAEAMLEGGAE